jgi:minor extracellular serine protease Vpr
MKHLLRAALGPAILYPFILAAQPAMPATTLVGVAELQQMAQVIPEPAKLVEATQGSHPTALLRGRCMVGFLGLVAGDLPEGDASLMIGARIGNILSFRLDATQLDRLQELYGLQYVELAGKVAPDLDRLVQSIRADSVHAGINLPQAYTGEGVLIGITDWGFDYTHPVFLDNSLTNTRIRAAWDHYRQAGPAPPGFDYGTELTTLEDMLEVGSDTANIYSYATHGNHVAGIAGGSAVGTNYRGVAFGAQFLFNTFLVDAAAVIDAFVWMRSIADLDQKRLVVNMSWGLYHLGTLDGQSLISQAIDQLADEGVVFVTSAGNNGNVNFHIKRSFNGELMRTRVQFYPYNAHPRMWGQSLHMWGEPGLSFAAGIVVRNNLQELLAETPMYQTATQAAYLDSMLVIGNDTVFFNLTADAAHPLNGRPHFRLRVKNTNTQLSVHLHATAAEGTVHFWNVTELTNDVGNWGQAFQGGVEDLVVGDAFYGIGEPACSAGTLSVAAYNAETTTPSGAITGGAIASFSSWGPTLDERIKPDIAAPGMNVASAISSFSDANYTTLTTVEFQGVEYPFARFSGTSMSSPAVAGIAALLLQADPELSAAQVRDVIRQTARTDAQTGEIPPGGSTRWGWGKANAYRAIVDVLGVTHIHGHHAPAPVLWPNPTSNELYLMASSSSAPALVTIADVTGRVVYHAQHGHVAPITLATGSLPAGLYLVTVEQEGLRGAARFVKE